MWKSRYWCLILAFSCLALAAGCYESGTEKMDGQDAGEIPIETMEVLDNTEAPLEVFDILDMGDGGRDPLICDAIYVPFITFTFTDGSTGEAYCGPAEITYEVSSIGDTGTVQCQCTGDVMISESYGSMPCHINPPEGETSRITVSVEGYGDFSTEVTLPYECHPQERVDVVLWPLDDACPARQDVWVTVYGPQPYPESRLTISSEARIVSLGPDDFDALVIDMDFSEFDPERDMETFRIGTHLDDLTDLSVGDVVRVDYSFERQLPRNDTRLVISRDLETIVAGYDLGHSGESHVVCGAAVLDIIMDQCLALPSPDGCGIFQRLGYSVACESSAEPVEVFDGSRATVPCASGSVYEVLVGNLYQLVEDLDRCTDIPPRVTQLLVVKHR